MKNLKRMTELEKRYVAEVIDGQFESKNVYKKVVALEKKFAERFNAKHAIAMVNGTATLHSCLEALEVREGDEVICPPLTMSATSFAILQAGAIPVFADVDEKTFVITLDSIKKCITNRTKAIITVSLYGLSPNMTEIMAFAKSKNLRVIEDNAQSFLSYEGDKIVGSIGDMASYSFQSSKHMTCGEGGIVITNDDNLAVKIRRYSGLGYASIGLNQARISKSDIQDPSYLRHSVLGWNYRMSDLCGAVALAQLERLEELVEIRQIAAKHYLESVKGCAWLDVQEIPKGFTSSYWTFVLKLKTEKITWHQFRDKFAQLGGYGIYGAWQLSYLEPAFLNLSFLGRENAILKHSNGRNPYKKGICPNAEKIQPNLLQFKTNFWNEEEAIKQANILKETIDYFNKEVIND